MIEPAEVTLRAYRGIPFVDVTDFLGQDYTGATFRVEIRRYRDAPDLILALDTQSNPAAEGVSVTVSTDVIPTSSVQIRINETTLEALQYSSPRGGFVEFEYALDITGGGFGKHRRMQGAFLLEASANA